MKMIATDNNLNLIKMYDLGDRANKGPDHDEFNYDITTKSDLYYMEMDKYIQKLQAMYAGEEAKARAEARIRERQDNLYVYADVS